MSFALVAILSFGLPLPQVAFACPDINGLADLNCDGRLVIAAFGDSITVGEGDSLKLGYPGRLRDSFFPQAVVRNFGKGGEKTNAGRSRAASVFSRFTDADYAIILQGVNDYYDPKKSAGATRSNILSIERSAKNSGAVTAISSLTDIRRSFQRPWVLSVNSQIRPNRKIDFFSLGTGIISNDKLHPNGAGYQQMATLAAAELHNISSSNRPADTDGDGIYNFAETRFGTNPNLADTDGDGINDGDERYVYGSNPLALDSDGDGFSDHDEVFVRQTNPSSPLPRAPTLSTLVALP